MEVGHVLDPGGEVGNDAHLSTQEVTDEETIQKWGPVKLKMPTPGFEWLYIPPCCGRNLHMDPRGQAARRRDL